LSVEGKGIRIDKPWELSRYNCTSYTRKDHDRGEGELELEILIREAETTENKS
jgi:hypothetical protein